jgi:signal transduction histidine kinase
MGEGTMPIGDVADPSVAAALEALDKARVRFMAVVGHELRTPVTTLRGLAEALPTATAAEVHDELAPALLRNARRVERLLDDLLVAADIATVLPVGDPEPVDLVATAQAVWDALADGDDLDLDGDHEAVAALRPGAADEILQRVLDNAHRYGEGVALRSSTTDGRVRLVVSSGGGELSKDDLALAFEVFYRGEAAVTTAPGFGLGLPVARALARHHGGDVTLSPREGGGLDVAIEVPAAR